jgi:hypothetical protein
MWFVVYTVIAAGNTWATINPAGYIPVGLSAGMAVFFSLLAVREALLDAGKKGRDS